MNETAVRTTLGMDPARNRIRINVSTLRAIGSPAYVQLLVNPESRIFAIRAVDRAEKGDQTYRMPKRLSPKDTAAVITSQTFMTLLRDAFPDLDPSHTYQLSGVIVPSERLTMFSIDTMKVTGGQT